MLKTFYTGASGWADRQQPDGTVVWTSPSGKVYTTTPGGALFFPALALSTGELEVAYTNGPHPTKRGLMMPTRRRTRTQDRAHRIAVERQHNVARIRRRRLLLPAHLARDYEPPPF